MRVFNPPSTLHFTQSSSPRPNRFVSSQGGRGRKRGTIELSIWLFNPPSTLHFTQGPAPRQNRFVSSQGWKRGTTIELSMSDLASFQSTIRIAFLSEFITTPESFCAEAHKGGREVQQLSCLCMSDLASFQSTIRIAVHSGLITSPKSFCKLTRAEERYR